MKYLTALKTIEIRVPEPITERDVKLATAVDVFNRKLVSLNRAAEISEVPLQEFLVELKKRGISAYPYADEEALRELEIYPR